MRLHRNDDHCAQSLGNKIVESMVERPLHQNSGLAVENYDLLVTGLDLRSYYLDIAVAALLHLGVLLVLHVLCLRAQLWRAHDVSVHAYRSDLLLLVKVMIWGHSGCLFDHVLYDARAQIRVQLYA